MNEGKDEPDNTPIGVLQALVADLEAENERLRFEIERLKALIVIGAFCDHDEPPGANQ